MSVSIKMCIFNAIVFVILVQIVANSPYTTSQQPIKCKTALYSKNFMVLVKSRERVLEKLCDGFVISPSIILASAHCLYDSRNSSFYNEDDLFIEFPQINSTDTEMPFAEKILVKYVSVPDNFDIITMKDDIALIFLQEHISKAETIEISNEIDIDNIHYLNDEEEVIPTKILSKDMCGSFYRPASILEGMMCVKDEKYTDSQAIFGGDKIVGFESWKNNAADLTYPKVFTNLAHHLTWINKETQNHCEKDYGVIGIVCYALFTIYVVKRSIKRPEGDTMGIQ